MAKRLSITIELPPGFEVLSYEERIGIVVAIGWHVEMHIEKEATFCPYSMASDLEEEYADEHDEIKDCHPDYEKLAIALGKLVKEHVIDQVTDLECQYYPELKITQFNSDYITDKDYVCSLLWG